MLLGASRSLRPLRRLGLGCLQLAGHLLPRLFALRQLFSGSFRRLRPLRGGGMQFGQPGAAALG